MNDSFSRLIFSPPSNAHSSWLPEMTFLSERVQHHCTTSYGKFLHVSFLYKIVKCWVSTRVNDLCNKIVLQQFLSYFLLNWERTFGSQDVELCVIRQGSIMFQPLVRFSSSFYCLIWQMFWPSWNKVPSWAPNCCQNVLHRPLPVHHSKLLFKFKASCQ